MKDIISGENLFGRLNATDWKKILPRLHYYSLNKLQRFPVIEEMYNIKGLAAEFADEAIRMVWDEQRKWNINYYPDLYDFLKGIVDSLISNFVNSKKVEITEPLAEANEHADLRLGGNPEEAYIRKETEAAMLAVLKGDTRATEVFDCLKDGLKPREIAEELHWDVQEVYNTLKRVQRKLTEYKRTK